MVKNEKGIGFENSPIPQVKILKGETMNKEFNNIWKFIKSEDPSLASMGITMANGLNDMDNTKYQNSDNVVSYLELKQKVYDYFDNNNLKSACDTLNPKTQMKTWYWYYVIALIQGRNDDANHNLSIWESYRKDQQPNWKA